MCPCSAVSVEVGDGDPCSSRGTRVIDVFETMEVPESGHVGIRAPFPKRGVGNNSPAEVHGHRMGNKQEELEKYGTVALREAW